MAKIIFVSPTAWTLFCDPPRTSGGAELDLYHIALALTGHGHKTVFFTSRGICKKNHESRIMNQEVFSTLRIIGGLINTFRLWRELSKQKPAAVFVKGAGLIVFQVGLWARVTNTQLIWRASHEQNFEQEYLKNRWWYWFYRLGLKWASARVVQTHVQKELLKKNFDLDGVTIYNAHVLPSAKDIISTKKRSGITWIGRARSIKQPFLVFDIAQKFSQTPLTMIVGEGDAEIHRQIRQKANEHPNINLYESLPIEITEQRLAKSRIFVLTSLKEGFANVIIQALKWGIPVVSLNVNPDNFIKPEHGGIFCNGSKEIVFQAIERLLTDAKWYNELSGNARQAAEQYFDLAKVIKQYELLLPKE